MMRLKNQCAQMLLTSKTSHQILILEWECPPKTVRNDFEHREGRSRGYFVIVNVTKKCMIWAAPGNQNYLFSFGEENAKAV